MEHGVGEVREARGPVRLVSRRRVVCPGGAALAAAEIVHPQILEYQRWLAVHRGLSDRSVSRQGRMIKRLLPALGEDPGSL